MAGGLKDFLVSIEMSRYVNMFQMRGYDDEADIAYLTVSDLQTVGVSNPMDIIVILKAAHSYKQSAEYELLQWLRQHGLSHYYEGFVQSERVHLSDIAQLNLPDEDLYDELEVTLPGHRRRLERAVNSLRKHHRPERREEPVDGEGEMVTEGWWGYPPYLPDAKFPFLCVRAVMQSTRQPESQQQSIELMVDSGSDVSTLRESVVHALGLEAISTVKSCGAHGSVVRTTMYRAYLIIGHCKMEIEVIGSSYDSIGSRVLRHFKHRIDSTRHQWYAATSNSPDHESETETVSVLPERERGGAAPSSSRTTPGNPGSSNKGGGDGGNSSRGDGREGVSWGGGSSSSSVSQQQGGEAVVSSKKQQQDHDEADCLMGSSQQQLAHFAYTGFSATSVPWTQVDSSKVFPSAAVSYPSEECSSWQPPPIPPQRRKTTDDPWPAANVRSASSTAFNNNSSSRLQRCLSDNTTDREAPHHHHYAADSLVAQNRSSAESYVAQQPQAQQHPGEHHHQGLSAPSQDSGHSQGGHLIFSGDGTISLSFGRRKQEREDGDSLLGYQADH